MLVISLNLNTIKGACIEQPSGQNPTCQLRLGTSSKADQYESYCF